MADIHALVEGQQVEIWSRSQQRWEYGAVVQHWRGDSDLGGIMVLVKYGDPEREKWLDTALVIKFVRVATRPQGPAMADAGPAAEILLLLRMVTGNLGFIMLGFSVI